MDIIIKDRAHGKTSDLVRSSAYTGIPIVCPRPDYIKDCAEQLGIEIPEPIPYYQYVNKLTSAKKVYIDELDFFIRYAFGSDVECVTISRNE